MTHLSGFASNVPFTAPLFSGRVWNGRLCHDTPDNCVETLFASDNGGAVGGAVYFDVRANSQPCAITGSNDQFPQDSPPAVDAGRICSMEIWTKSGTLVRGLRTTPAHGILRPLATALP